MAEKRPGIDKKWLAFALDMNDDSDAELDRVLSLQRLDFERAITNVDATHYQAANAVKILPSLLEQLGLLSINIAVCNLTPLGVASLAGAPSAPTPAPTRRGRRIGYGVATPEDVHDLTGGGGRPRTTEEQLHSAALLEERTSQHQELVKRIVASMGNVSDVRCSDDAFDIAADSVLRNETLLIEAKTLRGDALVQARLALGQLLFYEYFDFRPVIPNSIVKIAAFDSEPGDQARQFLGAFGVETLVFTETEAVRSDTLADYFIAPM
ncbi:MAG: hypothetical protein HYY02_01660 [Chloroflexi bacterium]|nr:hypothetical protein [Chloroflexota bacterium]